MPAADRRQSIIDATLPLLLEQGPDVSTREIAKACGIAEGTIFRAFDTKQDLIHATLHAAFEPEQALAELSQLPPDQDLNSRTQSILVIIHAEIRRTRALLSSLLRDGHPPRHHRPPHGGPSDAKQLLETATRQALLPYQDELRLPVETAAHVLAELSFALGFDALDQHLGEAARIADAILHGIAKGEK